MIHRFLLKNKTVISKQNADYVDLGLPSGLLWATRNIGADDPTEYGDYFMWGSTEPDTDKQCDWEHAPFNDGSNDYDRQYFNSVKDSICPNGVLAPEYDAATAILGDDWRLPTNDDFKELIDNTKHEWIKNYKGSNVNGMVFTPVGFEANGTELFIPASGDRMRSVFYDQGSHAYLWSSSIFTSSQSCTRRLYFSDSSCSMSYSTRYNGFCIRGVMK